MTKQEDNEYKGYIRYYRHWSNMTIFKDESYTQREAFVDLHLSKKFKDTKTMWNGRQIIIKKGQAACCQENLAKKWGWSIATVKRFFKLLKENGLIKLYRPYGFSVVEMIEYYDEIEASNFPDEEFNEMEIVASPQPPKTKIDISDIESKFKEVWDNYEPFNDVESGKRSSKGNKKTALNAYKLIITKGVATHEEIIKGVNSYVNQCQRDKVFTKHVATWLNQEGWADEYENQEQEISFDQAEYDRLMAQFGGKE